MSWKKHRCRRFTAEVTPEMLPELVQSPNHFGRTHRAEVALFAVFRHFILV
jgi:hypothetical protein